MKNPIDNDAQLPSSGLLLGSEPMGDVEHRRFATGIPGDGDGGEGDTTDGDAADADESDGGDTEDTQDADGKD